MNSEPMTLSSHDVTAAPTRRPRRIAALDVLRGFALCGIILVNLPPLFGLSSVTADGEVVEGITRVTPPPSSFAVKYAPGGREAIVGAYHAGQLGHLALGATLPAITPAAREAVRTSRAKIVTQS